MRLTDRRKSWPAEERDSPWPTAANVEAIKRQPPAREGRAWYVLLQAVPKQNTVVYKRLAGRVMGYCKMQIAAPEDWKCVTAGLNEMASTKITSGFGACWRRSSVSVSWRSACGVGNLV